MLLDVLFRGNVAVGSDYGHLSYYRYYSDNSILVIL